MTEAAWFGERLRELREAASLSRKDLAARAEMQSEAGIRNLEQGIRNPTWETVLALAKALGVSCESFTQQPGEHEPVKPGRPSKRTAAAMTPAEPQQSAQEARQGGVTAHRTGDQPDTPAKAGTRTGKAPGQTEKKTRTSKKGGAS